MNNNYIESLANIAKDRIGKKNPFPKLDGFNTNFYGCKWGLSDLYPEEEKILRKAISDRRTFDTDWVECQKEICSFRLITDGNVITIQASASMDDFEDLIYDALDEDIEFTEEQLETLWDYWNDCTDISTDVMSERTINLTTYDEIMKILDELQNENDKQLNEWFEIIKSWLKEVVKEN